MDLTKETLNEYDIWIILCEAFSIIINFVPLICNVHSRVSAEFEVN